MKRKETNTGKKEGEKEKTGKGRASHAGIKKSKRKRMVGK